MVEERRGVLGDDEVRRRLEALPGWVLGPQGDRIRRELRFVGFLRAIDFIKRIAPHAEALDHHPEIHNIFVHLTLELTTHDAGGLTPLDFELAERIDGALEEEDLARDE